jgi:hypothetical protein
MTIARLSVAGILRMLAFVVLLALAAPRTAAAQGTTGTLPDPISSRDLVRYAERLDLNDAQREAMETAHDEYRRDFTRLREGEIESFLEDMRSMQGGMPRADALDEFLQKWDRLLSKIKTLDNGFFTRFEPLLSDEQKALLPRLRLLRERQRYHADQMAGFTGRRAVDLSEIFVKLDLEPEVFAQVDPAMAIYEHQLTKKLRVLAGTTQQTYRDMLAAFEELGYGELTEEDIMDDPELMKRLMEDMQRIWADIMERATEAAQEVSDLNRKTVNQVTALLPPEPARTFRTRYLQRAYPEITIIVRIGDEAWLTKALESEEITDDQRSEIAALIETHRLEGDRLTKEAVKHVETNPRGANPFNIDQEAMEKYQKKLSELQSDANELTNRTRTALQEIMTPEVAEGEDGETEQGPLATTTRFDMWVPRPISTRDVKAFADELELDESARDIATGLLEHYEKQLAETPIIIELVRKSPYGHAVTRAPGERPKQPTEDERAQLYELRKQVRAAMETLDSDFFEDLVTLLPEKRRGEVERLAVNRRREGYINQSRMFSGGFGGSQEESIDLVKIVDGLELDEMTQARLDPVVAAYETASLPLLRGLFEARMSYMQMMEGWSARVQEVQSDPAEQMMLFQSYRETMAEATKKVTEAGEQVATLNRQSFAAMAELLSGTGRDAAQRLYNFTAYPTVYGDPVSVESHLEKALALEDLTPAQRDELTMLAGSYEPEYEGFCQQMIGVTDNRNMMFAMPDQTDWQEYQQRQEKLQKLRFERDELSYRAINRLQILLTAEQIEQIGGLPEPQEKRDWPW